MSQKSIDKAVALHLSKLDSILEEVKERAESKVSKSSELLKFKTMFKKNQPKNLMGGSLKPYQHEALVWMIELSYRKMNGILADDMGLGKTIQTISYLAYLKQEHRIEGKHLIIAPLTVLRNWDREIKKWLPSLNVKILYATQKQREEILATTVKNRDFDVLITSYQGAVVAMQPLKRIRWETLTIDEAHKIKNDESIISETVKRYRSNFKLLLTGTPLSNQLRELWSLLNFCMPDIFNDRAVFDEIELVIKESQSSEEEKFRVQCSVARKFHQIIRPFIMRRTKQDTDLGLPPKTIKTLFVGMTKLQLRMYKNVLKYRSVYGPNGAEHFGNKAMVYRKICNHPYLFDDIEPEKVQTIGEHYVEQCGKMLVLDKLLKKLIGQERKKILLFSQFTMQLDVLEDYCSLRDYRYFRLDGQSSLDERERMMDDFNNDKDYKYPIFMLSTRAGGLGVNLVSASIVIIYDIDWNPQNDNQAMDRAYRIGQTQPVQVFKMVTEYTIEERMLEVQKYKLIWDELVIQKGTVMNIRNEDVMAGLNYEKIANMKKGDVFRIQANQDNMTIEEIIAMGEEKDEKKHKEIKAKIDKQIEKSKKENGEFNANPFDQEEYQDTKGQALIKDYHGVNMLQNRQKNSVDIQRNNRKAKFSPQFYHLPSEDQANQIKKVATRIGELQYEQSKRLEDFTEDKQKELGDLYRNLQTLKQESFCHWKLQQFKIFKEKEMEVNIHQSDRQKEKAILQLKKQLPKKSLREIQQYRDRFYSYTESPYPQFFRQKKLILKNQEKNMEAKNRQTYLDSLKDCDFAKYNDRYSPMANYLSALRIQNGYQNRKDLLTDQKITEEPTFKFLSEFVNFQRTIDQEIMKVPTPTNLLLKFRPKDSHDRSTSNSLIDHEISKDQDESTVKNVGPNAVSHKVAFSGSAEMAKRQMDFVVDRQRYEEAYLLRKQRTLQKIQRKIDQADKKEVVSH